jgi:hypothetical protein
VKESEIQFAIRRDLAIDGLPLWRNNVGFDRERKVHYGLGLGSPDLVGILPIIIEPRHVGRTLGVFVGVEVKSATGRVSADQTAWHRVAGDRGGLIVVARSSEEAGRAVDAWRRT